MNKGNLHIGQCGFFRYMLNYFTHITPLQISKKDDIFVKDKQWVKIDFEFMKEKGNGYKIAFFRVSTVGHERD